MSQRRHHYEVAFEAFLRERRIPCVSVNEARKALLPEGARLTLGEREEALKSFDFVVYGDGVNLLIDIKGRKVGSRSSDGSGLGPVSRSRLQSWVTSEDVRSLRAWERLFGPGFEAVFVFVYWCDEMPPDGLFQEVIVHRGRWYAVRAVTLASYAEHMRERSKRWGTVFVPTAAFERISQPFAPPITGSPAAESPGVPALDPIGADPGVAPVRA